MKPLLAECPFFQIHAIGHSLGAHLVGHLGRNIESSFGKGKIGRVTGINKLGLSLKQLQGLDVIIIL